MKINLKEVEAFSLLLMFCLSGTLLLFTTKTNQTTSFSLKKKRLQNQQSVNFLVLFWPKTFCQIVTIKYGTVIGKCKKTKPTYYYSKTSIPQSIKILVFTSQLQSTLKLQKFNSHCYKQYPLRLNLMVK